MKWRLTNTLKTRIANLQGGHFMKKLNVALLLSVVIVVFSTTLDAQDTIPNDPQAPVLSKIRQILHEKSWYYGCPDCRDKFDTAFKEVLEGSSDWEKLTNFYGGCLMEDHRETEAINLWSDALKIDPDNYLFLSQIGTSYLRLNDLEKAEEYCVKSNEKKLNRIASYHLAHIHFTKGVGIDDTKNKKNKEIRKKLLAKAEDEILTTIDLYARKDEIGCISRYTKNYSLSLLANIKVAQGEVRQAQELFLKLIDDAEAVTDNWHPKRKEFTLTELYFNYGQMLYINGQQQEGLIFMNKSIDTAPTESLKKMKKIGLDLTINPAKNENDFRARYPQIKFGTGIPLY